MPVGDVFPEKGSQITPLRQGLWLGSAGQTGQGFSCGLLAAARGSSPCARERFPWDGEYLPNTERVRVFDLVDLD